MSYDDALRRYLRNPDVARWLFCNDPVTTVSANHLDACFVYSIGFNRANLSDTTSLHVEDMLIVSSTTSSFILGVVWGLGQPHIFSRTPLMLDKSPVARRFAVDLSPKDALEFMEFLWFADGKVVVVFRRFLHTRDGALPCIVYSSLHNPSTIENTLGHVLMRAFVREASLCPICNRTPRDCDCAFDAYRPTDIVPHQTFTWNHFNVQFMNKARLGSLKIKITAYIPNVGDMLVMDDTLDVVNIMHVGDSDYLNILRRKAVHGLGVNVVIPRADSLVLALADENDFVNLHNNYVSRKRARGADQPTKQRPFAPFNNATDTTQMALTVAAQAAAASRTTGPTSNSLTSVEDIISSFASPAVTDSTTAAPKAEVDFVPENAFAVTHHSARMQGVLAELEAIAGEPATSTAAAPEVPALAVDTAFAGVTASSALGSVTGAGAVVGTEGLPGSGSGLLGTDFDPSTIATPPAPALPVDQGIQESFLDELEALLAPSTTTAPTAPSTTGYETTANKPVVQRSQRTGLGEPKSTSSVSSEDSNTRPATVEGSPQTGPVPVSEAVARVVEGDIGMEPPARRRGGRGAAKRAKRSKRREEDEDSETAADRKHACTQCSSRFKMRGDLLRHVKIVHEGRRMFSCETCGKSFGHSGHLNRHISSVHLQQRRFKCHLCGFQFFQASHLQSHIGHIHNAKKSVQCKVCGLRVNSQAALRQHLATSSCGGAGNAAECRTNLSAPTTVDMHQQQQLNA